MQQRRTHLLDDGILLFAALVVRLLYGLLLRDDPLFGFPLVDARLFWEDALALAGGAGGEPVFYKPPLLSYLLALWIRVGGADAGSARLFLLVLSALAAPLVARLARPVLGRAGGFVAGAFAVLYAPALFYGGEILPASTVLLLNVLLLLVLVRAEERGRMILFGAGGVLLGISALARPTVLLFLLLLALRYRRVPKRILLLAAGTALGLLPATIHNARGGDFVLVSSNGGINFHMGNHAGADGKSAWAPGLSNEPGEARRAARAVAEKEAGGRLRPSEVSDYWYRRGFAWILENPDEASRLLLRKAYYSLNDREISDNIDFRAVEEENRVLRLMPFRFGLLFALALPGFVAMRRRREGTLLLLYALAIFVSMVLFFVVGRFRLPLLPALAVGGAAGLLHIAGFLRRDIVRAVPALLLACAGFLLAQTAWVGVGEEMVWHYHYLRGDALYRQGRLDEAAGAFEESFRRNDRVPMTRNALAFLYAERGVRLERAEELVRGAIDLEPGRRRFYLDTLGWVLHKKGEWEEAAAALQEAIPLFYKGEEASLAEALRHLADVREAEGRGEEADSLRAEAEKVLR